MANFLKSKAKLLILIYGVVIALVLLFALCFMTNFANVHVFYKIEEGEIQFNYTSVLTINNNTNATLFRYFRNLAQGKAPDANPLYDLVKSYGSDAKMSTFADSGLAKKVYDFQKDMSDYNDDLIVFFLCSIVLFVCMLICSNQSRKVYYISNLVVGIVAPIGVIVGSVLMLSRNMSLMSRFNDNKNLFKAVAYLQDEKIQPMDKDNSINDWSVITKHTKDVNSLPFIFGIVVLTLVIVYSLFMIVYTVYRYKESSKRRAEIKERAAKAND